MNIVVYTIFEKNYHLGVAALINSLYQNGFRGKIFAAYRGEIPGWADQRIGINFNAAENLDVIFCKTAYVNHLSTLKPNFGLDILNSDKNIDGVVYFDPDIVALVDWSFFLKWIQCGVALCSDIHRYMMHPTHPIKQMWKAEVGPLFPYWRDFYGYANSGFVGVSRENMSFLSTWSAVIDHMQIDTLRLDDPTHPFNTQDQDALNAAIHVSDVPISLAGQEEMGFFASAAFMAHALGPKPWGRGFVRHAFSGRRPSFATKQYWRYVEKPIRVFSPFQVKAAGLEMLLARVIAGIRG